jgi:hypothetical protein
MTGEHGGRFPESFAEFESRISEVWRRHRMLVSVVYVGALVGLVGGFLLAWGVEASPNDASLMLVGSGIVGVGLLITLVSNIVLQRARLRERRPDSV